MHLALVEPYGGDESADEGVAQPQGFDFDFTVAIDKKFGGCFGFMEIFVLFRHEDWPGHTFETPLPSSGRLQAPVKLVIASFHVTIAQ